MVILETILISYASDITGIYEGGLVAGIFITIMAFTGLTGIVFGLFITLLVGGRLTAHGVDIRICPYKNSLTGPCIAG